MNWDSNTIDEHLRRVPVPPETLARLREVAAYSDRELDHSLGEVPTPAGVMSRLRKIGTLLDSDLDGEMRHVGVPGGVLLRLRRTVRRQILRPRLVQLAVAAALVFVVVGVYWINSEPQQPGGDHLAVKSNDNSNGDHHKVVPPNDPIKHGPFNHVVEKNVEPLDNKLPDEHSPKPVPDIVVTPAPKPPTPVPPPFKVDDVLGNLPAQSAEFHVAAGLSARGIAPPRVRGYDWQFLFKNGVQPFVDPRSPALREPRADLD